MVYDDLEKFGSFFNRLQAPQVVLGSGIWPLWGHQSVEWLQPRHSLWWATDWRRSQPQTRLTSFSWWSLRHLRCLPGVQSHRQESHGSGSVALHNPQRSLPLSRLVFSRLDQPPQWQFDQWCPQEPLWIPQTIFECQDPPIFQPTRFQGIQGNCLQSLGQASWLSGAKSATCFPETWLKTTSYMNVTTSPTTSPSHGGV